MEGWRGGSGGGGGQGTSGLSCRKVLVSYEEGDAEVSTLSKGGLS